MSRITRSASTEADTRWVRAAVELSRCCPLSSTAFSVGAIVVAADGEKLADGYSRRDDPHEHAEEAALQELDVHDPRLREATIYSSLEPCGKRASRLRTCAELILETSIPRVVFGWHEPTVFVEGTGARRLREAGRTVLEIPDFAADVHQINAHLLD